MPRRSTRMKIQKMKNSYYVFIPLEIAKTLSIKKGDIADFELRGDLIVMKIKKSGEDV